MDTPPYTLDADATLIEGGKRDAHWRDLGGRGSRPMLGFLGETPVCLVDEFREGHVSPGAGPLEVYRPCRTQRPAGTRLARYRADRASSQAARINAWEAEQVRWAITADPDGAVNAVLHGIPSEAWQEPEGGGGDPVADAGHTMNQTKTTFRLRRKREERHQGELFDAGPPP